MVTVNEACKIAYEKRDQFNAVFEVGVEQVFDRLTYWTVGFDYVDPESHGSPYAIHSTGKQMCFCIDKESGEEVDGENFSLEDILSNNIPGHEVAVPDKYYRVPWYKFEL